MKTVTLKLNIPDHHDLLHVNIFDTSGNIITAFDITTDEDIPFEMIDVINESGTFTEEAWNNLDGRTIDKPDNDVK